MNTKQTEALKLALEALEPDWELAEWYVDELRNKAITAIRAALASKSEALAHAPSVREQPAQQEPVRVPVTDNTYNYAKSLAEAIFKQHFASDEHYSSGRIVWGVNDTVIGILTQIDNMVADMVRKPAQQQEPVGKVNELFDEAVIEQCGFDRELLVYTSPPNVPMARASKPWVHAAEWRGLTQQDIDIAFDDTQEGGGFNEFARAIEAKLREKNEHREKNA